MRLAELRSFWRGSELLLPDVPQSVSMVANDVGMSIGCVQRVLEGDR